MSYVVTVKSTVEISQNFVAFSEYMNFTLLLNSFPNFIFLVGIACFPTQRGDYRLCLIQWALTSLHKQGGSVMINVLECAREKKLGVDIVCT